MARYEKISAALRDPEIALYKVEYQGFKNYNRVLWHTILQLHEGTPNKSLSLRHSFANSDGTIVSLEAHKCRGFVSYGVHHP